MTSVVINGNTYSDNSAAGTRNLDNGGHREWFLPLVSDVVTVSGQAQTSATSAAASAVTAVSAPGTNATSTSALTIGTGSKSLTIQAGKALVLGMSVKIASTASPTNWMAGDITAYNSTTGALTVSVSTIQGSGSFSAWTVSLSAPGAGSTWTGDVIAGQYGGTGVANTGKTITLGGNLTTSGAFAVTLTLTATTSVTLPTSGTLATLAGAETLTGKTVEAATFTSGYTEEVAIANTSTAYTIDLANGSVQVLTLTGNCVFTFPTATAGRSFLLVLKQDATGSRTATWPSVTNPVKWPGGTNPTITATASRWDLYAFTADGTNWLGRTIAQNYS